MRDGLQGALIKTLSERVFEEEMRGRQHMRVARESRAVHLERAEIIGVAECGADVLEDSPISLLALMPDLTLEMIPEVGRNAVVVEKGIIDVEEEDEIVLHVP